MAKTVTLKAARPGRDAVRVDDYVFYLGKAVRNVPEDVVERLRSMPGVQAHATASTRKTAAAAPEPNDEPENEANDEANDEPEPVPAPPTPEPPTAPEPTPESSEDD